MIVRRKLTHIIALLLCLFTSAELYAQPAVLLQKKPYTWMVGISWTAVEDDGRGFCQTFDVAQSWNYEYYPSRLVIDRYFKYGLSAELSLAYVNYRSGKLINGAENRRGVFFATDLNCKYSFYPLISQGWLDPFVSLGVGLTQRTAMPNQTTLTGNFGVGVNLRIYRGLGFQLQTSGKFAFTGGFFDDNYFQHQAGFIYKFNSSSPHRENFNRKRYKWTNKKVRYKGNKRGG